MDAPPGYRCLPLRSVTLPPATHTNCILVGERAALLVDPGSDFPPELDKLERTIAERRITVGAILLTHHHADHTAGAAHLARRLGVPVAAHPLTLERLPPQPGVDRLPVEAGHRFATEGLPGDGTLELLHTPGHTPGHLCLFEPARRLLLAGDMVAGVGTILIDPPEGDMAAYLEALEHLAALAPEVILPAHGPPITSGTAHLRALIEHRRWREGRLIEALGPSPQELLALTRAIYDDVSPLLWPVAARSTLAHLIKLEREGLAMRAGEGRWRAGGPAPG